jgi:hypothetical protein
MVSLMSINKLNVLADYRFPSLSAQLGNMIGSSDQILKGANPEETTKKVFNQFINKKIPTVKSQIQQLVNQHCISNMHYPMTLNMIFFTYLDELIEYYQAQQEVRDEKLDEQLQSIKYLVAQGRFDLWNRDPKELGMIVDEIRNKLNYSDILPPNFDHTISLWVKILQVQYVGELTLSQLYVKNLNSAHITHELKSDTVKISRHHIMQSFFLMVNQLAKDFVWISKRTQEKMPELADKNLERVLALVVDNTHINCLERVFGLVVDNTHTNGLTPVSKQFQDLMYAMRCHLQALSLVDFDDQMSLYSVLESSKLVRDFGRLNPKPSSVIDRLSKGMSLSIPDGDERIIVSEEAFPGIANLLVNYNECEALVRFFFCMQTCYIDEFLKSLILSNELWKNRNNVKLLLASEVASLLPTPIEYDESAIEDLLLSTSSSSVNVKKKGKVNTPAKKGAPRTPQKKKQPVKPEVKSPQRQLKSEKSSPSVPLTLISGDTVQASPIERLRAKLSHYCEITRSPALRQALWHLDALIAFQTSFDRSPLQAKECLSIACGVASCAQKVLEQTYRSLLSKKGVADLPTSHNLLHYHREFDPNFENCPEIVKKLCSANNWCRYFYSHEANLRAMSTQVVRIPPILSLFVQMAEGKTSSPAVLREFVDETIERASLHAESLLKGLDISSSSSLPPIHKAPISADSRMKISINGAAVSRALQNFLNRSHLNSHHPAYLYIKQALAALMMLQVSLQEMNKAKDLYALSAWNIWATQQLQESMEHVLRAIQYFQNGAVTIDHEMGKLAQDVGLEMEGLAEGYHHLSYKTRYPAEFLENTPLAESIDDLEFLKHHPEIMEGYTVKQPTTLLWKMPSENASLERIWEKLVKQIVQWEGFLLNKAIPLLETCVAPRRQNLGI